jgi:hypothetical protein
MIMTHKDDEFIELFEDGSEPPMPSAEFREAMLGRTTVVLRRRKRIRRAAIACAAVFIYGAGMGTALLFRGSEDLAQTAAHTEEPIKRQPDPVVVTAEMLGDWEAFSIRVAEAPPTEKVRLLRAAGDWYMEKLNDIETAASCYSAMFAAMDTETMLDLHEQDNWLIASLKLARLEEKSNDQKV